jgi:hypothetical protein
MASSKDMPNNPHRPVVLSIQTDAAGHFVLKSSDGCRGGTFLNRYAALREIDNQICMLDRVTVVLIEPGKSGSLPKTPQNFLTKGSQ